MVWRRMGLLDDAIRDHLELKRLRGADPGEVAREQREALEPDLRGAQAAGEAEPPAAVEEHGAEDGAGTLPVHAAPAVTATAAATPVRAPQPTSNEDASNVAEETAELDMSSVMDEDLAGEDSFGDLNEDQLQWEVPGDSAAGIGDAGPDDRAAGDDGR